MALLGAQAEDVYACAHDGPEEQGVAHGIEHSGARNFVRRAEELAKRGDVGQAKLQIKLALNMDPGNPALLEFERSLIKKP